MKAAELEKVMSRLTANNTAAQEKTLSEIKWGKHSKLLHGWRCRRSGALTIVFEDRAISEGLQLRVTITEAGELFWQ